MSEEVEPVEDNGYYEGEVVVSYRFLQMLKETGIVVPASYFDHKTMKLYVVPLSDADVKRAEEWYQSHLIEE